MIEIQRVNKPFAATGNLYRQPRYETDGNVSSTTLPLLHEANRVDEPPSFHYGRMFRNLDPAEYRPAIEALMALGLSMEAQGTLAVNADMPAGYTYLGQFISHDTTFFDGNASLLGGLLNLAEVISKSSPALDLDSLYGFGPELESRHPSGRRIYEDDGIRLRVGETKKDFAVNVLTVFPHDLPRGHNPAKRHEATIADPRNDENLIIAQMHLAFIYFHNAVVKRLSGSGLTGAELFQEARCQVVQHYQWIVLYDYLPRIVQADVLADVLTNGCRYFVLQPGEALFMPMEFAFAAFRFGHSQVRDQYQWNYLFQTYPYGFHEATLADLTSRTGSGDSTLLAGELKLPSSWIIDWTRFFDFREIPGVENHQRSNAARQITASLVRPLMEITVPVPGGAPLRSVAVLDLLRGYAAETPAGQHVAERLQVTDPLSPQEIAEGPQRAMVEQHGFDQLTPLWYYVLKEAQVRHTGHRLGPVGSRIVAETLVGLIKASPYSILADGAPAWQPTLGPVTPARFSMPDLLFFLQLNSGQANYLNPLGH